MLAGFKPSNMQDRCWLQRNAKRIEFRVDVDPFSSSRQDCWDEDHVRGHRRQLVRLVRSTLVGKENPERTGYLDELPA